eukprot:CAMPEP_0172567704 /NCGR_PEP_ID=MMETSP1067-20121228/116848_1 /TAXON_ID=265564 ORGANISM="Thalassiosira punctigera, Strain Tpunct2005C2" /NCGR_SAMPLE_ID=MMETSP1067 /ASSEMBLY_ACC=CAM_ASM_000444 /LENGTH=59 /DNA_ID=CAMNT_0013359113 /DNA_START=149 /DNA_END=324 /DNA_ORIENTATION=-
MPIADIASISLGMMCPLPASALRASRLAASTPSSETVPSSAGFDEAPVVSRVSNAPTPG